MVEVSDFKIEFELEQQTPMIHFQHNQQGACLRGSEVKPKLDKFILECLGRECAKKEKCDEQLKEDRISLRKKGRVEADKRAWLQKSKEGEENLKDAALKYKIQIRAIGKPIKSHEIENALKRRKEINGLYFGNMVKRGKKTDKEYMKEVKDKYKETVFYTEPIQIKILCFEKGLLEYIKKRVAAFFLLHNFGTRQDKGFGSFKVVANNEISEYNVVDEIRRYKEKAYYLDMGRMSKADYGKQGLEKVNEIYKSMKGGKGEFIYEYYKGKYYMDKLLKYSQRKFIRANLGLAESYPFMNGKSVSVKHKYIDRYPSPIDFKIIDRYIFLIPKPMPKILKEQCRFQYKEGSVSIDKYFNIDDFLKRFTTEVNKELVPIMKDKGGK